MNIISELKAILDSGTYARENPEEVIQTFQRLGVKVSKDVEDFFVNFAGPFWEETLGMEFLDIVEDEVNIESVTMKCRKEHSFPEHYLVLTEMVANEVIVLNTIDDKVYRVDFEGGDEKLLKGVLQAEWYSFEEFLIAYFGL